MILEENDNGYFVGDAVSIFEMTFTNSILFMFTGNILYV